MANAVTIQGVMTAVGLTSPTAAQLNYVTFCADYAEATIKKIRNQLVTEAIEAIYQPLAIQMATALYNRQGIEGAMTFAENGLSMSFDSSDIPRSMIKQVIPMGSVY
jgi:hypothetical protein